MTQFGKMHCMYHIVTDGIRCKQITSLKKINSRTKTNANSKKQRMSQDFNKISVKMNPTMRKTCYCQTDPEIYKSKKVDWEEIFEIPGISDVSVTGNDSLQTIQTCKVLLLSLGPNIKPLLEKSSVNLDYPFSVVKILHEFSLDGDFHCEPTNIEPLLRAAKEFNMDGIKHFGGAYLLSLISTENAHEIYRLSQELLCHHLTSQAKTFILDHFEKISKNDEFLKQCSPDWMKEFIKSDELNADEECIFNTLIAWSKINPTNEEAFKSIVKHVRFELLDPLFFKDVVKKCCPLESISCVDKLRRSKEKRWRIPKELVFAIGGFTVEPSSAIEIFDYRAKIWSTVTHDDFYPHAYHEVIKLDTNLFVIGGFGNAGLGPQYYKAAFRFDLLTKNWTEKSAMQVSRCYVSTAEVKGKIYAIGGYDGSVRHSSAECYDPQTNQWNMIKSMNAIRSDASAVTFGNKIFIVGGFSGEEILPSMEVYDPDLDEWSFGPRMNVPRSGLKAVVLNGKLYAIGGFDGTDRLRSVESLDLQTPNAAWKIEPQLSTQRSNFGVTILDNKIMVAGGFDGQGVIDEVEIYSDQTKTWTPCNSVNVKRSALSLITVAGLSNRKDYLNYHK